MCSDFMARRTWTTNDSPLFDHLFSFEETRKASQKLSCTVSTDESKTSLGFLTMFDAVMTETVDSFQYILQNLKQNERYVGTLEYSSRQ